jgi:hypothetical protein
MGNYDSWRLSEDISSNREEQVVAYYADILIQKKFDTEEEWEEFRNKVLSEETRSLDFYVDSGWSTGGFKYPDLKKEVFTHHRGNDAKD